MNAPDLPAFLDRRPLIWSFTMLNTYRGICPHQAARKYIVKDIPYKETPQMKRGNEVHSAFEYRVGGGKPLPVDMQQWEGFAAPFDKLAPRPQTEMRLGVTRDGHTTDFFGKNVWGRGKVDCPVIQGESAYFVDWKTGKVREDPFELEVCAVLLHARFPQLKKIKAQYCWLSENRMGKVHDVSDTRSTWAEIGRIVAEIENDRARGIFDKREGPLCKWCDVADCEFNKNPDIE